MDSFEDDLADNLNEIKEFMENYQMDIMDDYIEEPIYSKVINEDNLNNFTYWTFE